MRLTTHVLVIVLAVFSAQAVHGQTFPARRHNLVAVHESAVGTLRQFCDGRCSVGNADSRHKSGLRSFDATGGKSRAIAGRGMRSLLH